MNKKSLLYPLVFLLIGVLLVGCNLPINTTPTPFVFPTPNLTMTAIFNQPISMPPTVTPPSNQPPAGETLVIPTQIKQLPTVTPPSLATLQPTPPPTKTLVPGTAQPATAAVFLSSPPKIDGNWDDWNTTQFPISHVVFGANKWKNSDDLGGAYRVGWDNTYLYLAVKVTDNIYSQLAKSSNLYKGDSIELLLSTNPASAAANSGLTENDYQLGISPGNPSPGKNVEAYLWYPSDKESSQPNVKIAAISMDGGYRVEAAIPWSTFGVTPASGQQYGFAVSVSDDDQAGTAVQEKMISTAPKRNLGDPTTWGLLSLVK